MSTAYPLAWPAGRERTPAHQRESARFGRRVSSGQPGSQWTRLGEMTIAIARDLLSRQLESKKFGAAYVVLSTNVELRLDGQPYSNRRDPDDPGAAVYFSRDGGKSQLCIACDRYDRVADNVCALAKTVEALRGLERWGTKSIVDAAFSGFKALPANGSGRPWWTVLELSGPSGVSDGLVELQFRSLARRYHPDAGGSPENWHELQDAKQQAMDAIRGRS